ncbi:MAG TPA: hypothetical protein VN976_10955 [Verrucomicrobiae bacterium]|nr:hypothetical protein [Verrucomicrobiae bacterium]
MATTFKLVSKTTMGGVTRYQFDVGKDQGPNDSHFSIYQAGLKIERSLKKVDSQETALPDKA